MDSIDKTIKYYELLMALDSVAQHLDIKLPDGYTFVYYKSKEDIEDWINIHICSGEFASRPKGREYFYLFYGSFLDELSKRLVFIQSPTGEKIATATLSPANDLGYNCVIDWLAIDKAHQGKGLSKPLINKIINIAHDLGYTKILLHTQTNSWLAAKVYLDMGFNPLPTADTYGWRILNTIIRHNKLTSFRPLKESDIYDNRILSIKDQLDKRFSNYSYSVWYTNDRNDIYVHDFDTDKEYTYKFKSIGKRIRIYKEMDSNFGIYDITHNTNLDYRTRLNIYHSVGFREIGLYIDNAYMQDSETYDEIISYAISLGFDVRQVHMDYKISNLITDPDTEEYFTYLESRLRECERLNIPYLVAHASKGEHAPAISDKQLNKLVALAKKHPQVTICFENVRDNSNLDKILSVDIDNIRMCYDLGHAHAYDNEKSLLNKYKNKIICSHLHNNYGKDDHNLLTDGEIDYLDIVKELMNIPNISNCLETFPKEKGLDKNAFQRFVQDCYNSISNL